MSALTEKLKALPEDQDKAIYGGSKPFKTIIDKHDGRVDLRATITLPDGFMVEIAIEDSTGTPDVALYMGVPSDPDAAIPEDLVGRWDVARLKEQS